MSHTINDQLTPTVPSDEQKRAIWQAYRKRQPTRVPLGLYTNPRVVLNNPDWNPHGWTFEQAHHDPQIHVQVLLQHELYRRRILGQVSDLPCELPEVWRIDQMVYNVYEAAQLGAEIHFPPDQVPCTEPIGDGAYESLEQLDIDRPLEHGFLKQRLDFWHEMQRVVQGMTFEGRPVELLPWSQCGSDGPLTGACNLVGTEFLMDLVAEPDKADRLMRRFTDAVIARREAFIEYWKDHGSPINTVFAGLADDSLALISTGMYVERILPLHRMIYDHGTASQPDAPRGMHLCGDATRHFPAIAQQLGVQSFDTGFPVDHGQLRQQLGSDVEIHGGPHVELLLHGSPEQVFDRTREILQSGVMSGGRFALKEANNLPPSVPLTNLAAMYAACQQFGRYA